ncbi:MAG TPA: hypothetical protein VNE82_06240 [Candidatus Binataceae bacterium]|nr:hypothetical protein [Candidatus Binataceae bacterium]
MAKYTFVVLTNPTTAAQEAEYNEWYNKIHIPDVLNVPGFVAAQRFKLAETQFADAKPAHRYLALYELETDDLKGSFNELQKRVGTAEMFMSDAINMNDLLAATFTPVAERVLAKNVQRPRRAA